LETDGQGTALSSESEKAIACLRPSGLELLEKLLRTKLLSSDALKVGAGFTSMSRRMEELAWSASKICARQVTRCWSTSLPEGSLVVPKEVVFLDINTIDTLSTVS
jgi:hypothetical protein